MEIQKFLSLLAALIGFVGALFLSKGVLSLSPKAMLELTSPYSRIGYAPEQIISFAKRKADTVMGVFYILIAFLLQIISIVFFSKSLFLFRSQWLGFWIALAIVATLTIISSFASSRVSNWHRNEMGKIKICSHGSRYLLKDDFSERCAKEIESMARDLLGMKREGNESTCEFIKRVYEYAK